jgi:hypothetical protein
LRGLGSEGRARISAQVWGGRECHRYAFIQAGKALTDAEIVMCGWSKKWITGPRTAEETKKFEENKTYWERRAGQQ